MKLYLVFLAILNLSAARAGKPNIVYNGKIVNGEDASIIDFPYQASVLFNMSPFCGGSILNDHIVLTAAHCTHGQDSTGFSVHVGDTNVLEVVYGQFVSVNRIIQHPNYDPVNTNNDMSLLILSRKLVFNNRVQPIQLDPRDPPSGVMATVAGWGSESENGPLSRNLQKVNIPIFERTACNALYIGSITNNMMCAGYITGYYDSCQGDSGGPLVINGRQVGVVSFGNGCGRALSPGVYASVANMYNWLQRNINAN